MEKILQILAVFVLMAFVIHRMIKGREAVYRPYNYLTRMRPPIEINERMVAAVFEEGQAWLWDETRKLLFLYNAVGSLTIYRRKGEEQNKEMQWLAAPLNCTGMAFDPEDGRLYLEAEGYLFVYGA